jgi:hypothetical protein
MGWTMTQRAFAEAHGSESFTAGKGLFDQEYCPWYLPTKERFTLV